MLSLLAMVAAAALPASLAAAERVPAPVDQAESQQALDALQQLLSAYAAGNRARIESLVEPQMIGYSRTVEAMRESALAQKQLRVVLSDTKTLMSEDVAIVRTHWEKRFLSLPAMTAGKKSGNCTFVMHRDSGAWRLSALSGKSPFTLD